MQTRKEPHPAAPKLQYAFTLHVDLAPPINYGIAHEGAKRFIPITGGWVDGPKLQGEILPGGGDWNTVQTNDVVQVWARYSIKASDGTILSITNSGCGRGSEEVMDEVFREGISEEHDMSRKWYTKTFPRFEIAAGSSFEWLGRTCFLGDLLLPTRRGHVKINVYEVL